MKRSHITPPLIPLAQHLRDASLAPKAVQREAENKAEWFSIENKADTNTADIYIYNEIGVWGTSAQRFSDRVRDLDVTQINLHLNSPGGSVFDGVAIYNTLASHKANVTVYVDGLAASAASFIAQAGDEIIMLKGSVMMIHDASGMAWDNADGMRKTADILDLLSNNIADIYAARAGGKAAVWRGIMKEEAWYSPTEAVEAGLADKTSTKTATPPKPEDDKTPDAEDEYSFWEDRWDLSIFNHAGRAQAPSPKLIQQSVLNRLSKEEASVVPIIQNTETEPAKEEPVVAPAEEEVAPVPAKEEEAPEAPAEEVAPAEVAPADVQNAANFIIINGVRHEVPPAVAAHVSVLETFAKESKSSGRKAFVDSLASDNKIVASQTEGLQAFAASLTDEQFTQWKASWEAAQPLPLLATHAPSGGGGESGAVSSTQAQVTALQEIIQHHRNSGMKDKELFETNSYQKLQALYAEHPELKPKPAE
jgi:ATP-dependent protease ClpP protease subunit